MRLAGTRVAASFEAPTPSAGGARAVLEAVVAAVDRVAGPRRRFPAVGIAVPGFLDPTRRKVVRLSNVPSLNGVALAREVEGRLGVRAILDTDTNAGAVAEARLGAGRGRERVLYVAIGTGLGAALVVAGSPVRASRHTVGQVAHVPLGERGPRCYCGDQGCAETLLSARGVLWRARRAGLRGIHSAGDLQDLASRRGGCSPPDRAAARRVWQQTGEALGRLLRILAGLFSPDAIVIGGGLAGASEMLLTPARRHLEKHLLPRLKPAWTLHEARGARLAGAIGAALLARDASRQRDPLRGYPAASQ